MPFYAPEDNTTPILSTSSLPVPNWVLYAAAAGLLVFILVLVLILTILKKRKKKKLAKEAGSEQALEEMLAAVEAAPAEPQQGADVMTLQSERSMELRKNIRRFVDENPELAAQLLKVWLRGGNDNG
jgi:flagellar M-ring protein FliF